MKPVAHGTKPCKRNGTTINLEPCCSNSAVGDICYGAQVQPWPSTYFYDNENVGLNWFGDRFDSTSGPHAIFGFASTHMLYSSGRYAAGDNGKNGCSWDANNYYPDYISLTVPRLSSDQSGSDYCPIVGNDSNLVLFNQTFWEDVVLNNKPIWEAYKDAVEQRAYNVTIEPISIEAAIAYKYDNNTGFDGSEEQWNSTYRSGSNASMNLAKYSEVFRICLNPPACTDLEEPTYSGD